MTLEYAVERLYETGWTSSEENDLETLSDGRKFPSVDAVKRQFAEVGLSLSIKHNLMFNCSHAAWSPRDPGNADAHPGTVIGTCDREAAVYALAQLRETMALTH